VNTVPEGRELQRELRALYGRAGFRIYRLARQGRSAETPEDARLVAAVARKERRAAKWWLLLISIALALSLTYVFIGDVGLWDIFIVALNALLLLLQFRWYVRYPIAERRNMEMLQRASRKTT
jgi:hypothetical protein